MVELPLFPLRTVLFPGAALRLHIFEERYKRMMQLCIQTSQPFGVVLIRKGAEAFGPLAEPYLVGCTAAIDQVQRLEQGRLNLWAAGRERFRIVSLHGKDTPYLVGDVEPFPLIYRDLQAVQQAGTRLKEWVGRYLKILSEAGISQKPIQQFPEDPAALAYLAAAMLEIPPVQKQRLLESEDALDLVLTTQDYYRRELVLVKTMLSGGVEAKGAFSAN